MFDIGLFIRDDIAVKVLFILLIFSLELILEKTLNPVYILTQSLRTLLILGG